MIASSLRIWRLSVQTPNFQMPKIRHCRHIVTGCNSRPSSDYQPAKMLKLPAVAKGWETRLCLFINNHFNQNKSQNWVPIEQAKLEKKLSSGLIGNVNMRTAWDAHRCFGWCDRQKSKKRENSFGPESLGSLNFFRSVKSLFAKLAVYVLKARGFRRYCCRCEMRALQQGSLTEDLCQEDGRSTRQSIGHIR